MPAVRSTGARAGRDIGGEDRQREGVAASRRAFASSRGSFDQ
jgi:hypothetical protein